jgi:hypothetical protein
VFCSLDTDKLKATKQFTKEQNEIVFAEKKRLCGEILEKVGVRTMEIGKNNTGGGLTGRY